LWNWSSGSSGGSQYQASGFGLFRILGYSANNWLLLELVGLDESCGQPSTAVSNVSLDGPVLGLVNAAYPFTATVQNPTAAQPISYTWEATGQSAINHTNGLTDTAVFSWPTSGQKTITMTADNDLGPPVVLTHTIQIVVPLAEVIIEGPEVGLVQSSYTFTATSNPISATLPITYVWETEGQIQVTVNGGLVDTADFAWDSPGIKTITLTVDNGFGPPVVAQFEIEIEIEARVWIPVMLKP
jgi:hypothetical protein